jgi:hypothetical protein
MNYTTLLTAGISVAFTLFSCKDSHRQDAVFGDKSPLFQLLPADATGIRFRNDLEYDREFNIYRYRNFYNGGGVAIGDVNNDGLPDIYFNGNMKTNRLYLNMGNWKFRDIAEIAGVTGSGSWSTGVSMADINGDGWLDIYVCNSGNPRSEEKENNHFSRANECFINRGKEGLKPDGTPTFEERATALGLADGGLTTHAAFFDYDQDGDLDAYVLNNSFRPIGSFDLRKNLRFTRDSLGGHKLYRNDGNSFTDVSEKAGILGSVIAFGLGVTVGDLDLDGWQDIYVSNDFFERDYLYHNNGDGTFTEQLEKSMRHISAASMGADMADVNNDAFPDIFVTDMLPEPDYRIKTTTSFDGPDRFKFTSSVGYYNQFTRNTFQLNNGDGTFSEIACLGNMEATDWSWGALLFDMDNDGWKDVFVANGIAQDLTNQDYLMFASDPVIKQEIIGGGKVDFKRLIDSIPSEKVPNYAFRNLGNLRFENRAEQWGLNRPSFSNGSAYGDLDNDGDLDLVINNVNDEAFVYRNNSRELLSENHYLKVAPKGAGRNRQALGAKIYLRAGGQTFYQEQMPMRGFQSSMDARPNFGLGDIKVIDTLIVEWPDGRATLLTQVQADQTLTLDINDANLSSRPDKPWLGPDPVQLFRESTVSLNWQHTENEFSDWDRDRLLFFLYSTDGPRTALGDVNGDKREDLFFCGAKGQAGALFIQTPDGGFNRSNQASFVADAECEDVDAVFFDADGDGDQDLYVASGGNEAIPGSAELSDRLYLNNGKGLFTRKPDAIPGRKPYATACVRPQDVDGDGDQDLFVGMRLLPGKIGAPVGAYLLINDGKGFFSMTQPDVFKNLGLLTDAVWTDFNADQRPDLLVAGEWMAPTVFINDNGQFSDKSAEYGFSPYTGLWKKIETADLNGDGRPDFVVGNMGLNTRLKAGPETPLTMFFNDFDQNGTPEQILCRYNSGKLFPYVLRGDMIGTMPFLKKRFLHFKDYAGKTLQDVFRPEQMADAIELKAAYLGSAVFLSTGKGKYEYQELPSEAQFAPVFGIAVADVNQDGRMDIVSGGNFLGSKPEFGYIDADYGLVLLGDGKGRFTPRRSRHTGLLIQGEVRDLKIVHLGSRLVLVVARNNRSPLVFDLLTKSPG